MPEDSEITFAILMMTFMWILPAVVCPFIADRMCKDTRWTFLWAFLGSWLGGFLALIVLRVDEEKMAAAAAEKYSPRKKPEHRKVKLTSADYDRLVGGKK